MKKIIPVLAVLGGAAALVAYKMKKDEQKKIIDLDDGMLNDEALAENEEEPVEEGPISDPHSCCVDDAKKAMLDILQDADDFVSDTAEKIEDVATETKNKVKKVAKDAKEVFPALLEDEIQELKRKAKEVMEQMLNEGDIHSNERPVQHTVQFENNEDAENFKNTVINRGFVVTASDTENELIVLHITPLDEVKLIANILYIANEVRLNKGTYEGWTSKVAY